MVLMNFQLPKIVATSIKSIKQRVFGNNEQKLVHAIFVWSVITSLVLCFLVPPFQKADEIVHFRKSASIASGTLICKQDDRGVFINPIPKYINTFPKDIGAPDVAFQNKVPIPYTMLAKFSNFASYDQTKVSNPDSCSLPFLPYLPSGLAMSIPVNLGLNPLIAFYLGRLTNLGIALGLFWLAIKIIPRGLKLLPALILALPMTLHQISSFNKDAIHLGFGILAFSYIVKFALEKKWSTKQVLICLASFSLAILARPQYILISLSFFLVSNKKRFGKKILYFSIAGLLLLAILVIAVRTSLLNEIYSADAQSLGHSTHATFIYPAAQTWYLVEHPLQFPVIIWQTISQSYDYLFKGVIGYFGWLDYTLSWTIYLIFSMFFSIAVTVPYEFTIYDKSCQKILSKAILDASTIQYSSFTDLVTPVIAPTEDAVCVQIKPYHSNIIPEEALLLATDDQGNTLWPLIIY